MTDSDRPAPADPRHDVLVTGSLLVAGEPVSVTVGRPAPIPPVRGSGYWCRLAVDRARAAPAHSIVVGRDSAGALASALTLIETRFGVSPAEFLADATIGTAR
ncbi:hypothetical protein AB0H71_15765 [Nocardia sp. NPDC050697]|uniref:hypothetical protein n=1 Tax=Nocardia sp. NPDC050697 TaxID=3155158 RepID=UPI0033DEC355